MILLTWEAAFRLLRWPPTSFPAPSHILASLARNLSPLTVAIGASLVRLGVAFLLSTLLGAALGLAMWRWAGVDRFFGPLFLGLQALPSVCWAPLALLTFARNEPAILFMAVMASVFAIALGFRDGFKIIPAVYQRAGLMLGARGWRMYRYVLLPASLPVFATGLRQGFSFVWRGLMGGEFVMRAVRWPGLGFLLDQQRRSNGGMADIMAMMTVMILIGMMADRLVFAKIEAAIHERFGLKAAG